MILSNQKQIYNTQTAKRIIYTLGEENSLSQISRYKGGKRHKLEHYLEFSSKDILLSNTMKIFIIQAFLHFLQHLALCLSL